MKCPHCLVDFHDHAECHAAGQDAEGEWGLITYKCPTCKKLIIYLAKDEDPMAARARAMAFECSVYYGPDKIVGLVRPKGIARSPIPSEIPTHIADDYREACLVLSDSPKASAALSRRCLQTLLRDKAETSEKNLADQIDEVLGSKLLPPYLANDLDAVRNIGNFATHTQKSRNTGEIVDVEPQEAEWNLDVLEGLFDFFFVAPAAAQARRDALNAKLDEVGKPHMKGS